MYLRCLKSKETNVTWYLEESRLKKLYEIVGCGRAQWCLILRTQGFSRWPNHQLTIKIFQQVKVYLGGDCLRQELSWRF